MKLPVFQYRALSLTLLISAFIATSVPTASKAQDVMEYSTWFEPGEDLFGKTYDGRIIPTNMAIWVETQPGVFIADGSPALHPSEAAIVNEARVMVTDAAPQKREGSLWCMLWNSEHRMHGLVCTE